jgi:hypothetical protein
MSEGLSVERATSPDKIAVVDSEADLPTPGADGQHFYVRSTKTIWAWDSTTSSWVNTATEASGDIPAHHIRHEAGGTDEVNVNGLTGVLADPQDAGWLRGVLISTTPPSGADRLAFDSALNEWVPTSVAEIVTVGKSGCHFDSVASAISSITDVGPTKPYVVLVYPGVYVENPFTVPSYVALVGVGVHSALLISGSGTSDFILLQENTYLKNLSFQDPSNTHTVRATAGTTKCGVVKCAFYSGNIAIYVGDANTRIIVEECKVFDGYNTALLANYGRIDSSNVLSYATSVHFWATNSGILWLHNSGASGGDRGLEADSGATIFPHMVTLEDVNYGVYLSGPGQSIINGGPVVCRGNSLFDIYQSNSESFINLSGGNFRETRFHIVNWENIHLAYNSDDVDGYGQVISDRLRVGMPEIGRTSTLGEGGPTVRNMIVLTTDNTAGSGSDGANFVDVSQAARSESGSTFSFQGSGANYSILFGLDLSDGVDQLKHWGLSARIVTGSQETTGDSTSFVWEIWDGAAWVPFNVFCVHSDYHYRYGNMVFRRSNCTEDIRYGLTSNDAWVKKTINGHNLYWARVRITTALTSAPVFEQFRLRPSFTTLEGTGIQTFDGRARFHITLQNAGNIFGESGGVVSGSFSVGTGGVPTGWPHRIKNSIFNTDGDAIYWQFAIPYGTDTSMPLEIHVIYVPITASTTADFIMSVLPVETVGIEVADPAGGIVPIPRPASSTESRTSKQAQTNTQTVDVSDSTRFRIMTFGPYDISDYYEGDVVMCRLEGDVLNGSVVVVTVVEVHGVKWSHGRLLGG